MNAKITQTKKKAAVSQNTIENLKNLASPSSMIDQILGNYEDGFDDEFDFPIRNEKRGQKPATLQQEFSIFNQQQHKEEESVKREIEQLTEQIKQAAKTFQRSAESFAREVQDAENIALNVNRNSKEKVGIYDVNFLEFILAFIRSLTAKVGESRVWLQAMTSKKKKRGSLFASLSKRKGTQYSLSQELQVSRSTQ